MMENRDSKREVLSSLGRSISTLLFGFYLVFTLFPLLRIFSLAFQRERETTEGFRWNHLLPTLENFHAMLDLFYGLALDNSITRVCLLESFFHSMMIVGAATILSILSGLPMAYILSRSSYGKMERMTMLLLILRSLSIFMILLPLLFIFHDYTLLDTFIGMVLSYQLILLPLVIYVMYIYFQAISPSILESAEVDGASLFHRNLFIILPMMRPGLLLSIALAFIVGWQQLSIPLLFGGERVRPLTLAMIEIVRYEEVVGPMACASILASLPIFILLFWYLLWSYFTNKKGRTH